MCARVECSSYTSTREQCQDSTVVDKVKCHDYNEPLPIFYVKLYMK